MTHDRPQQQRRLCCNCCVRPKTTLLLCFDYSISPTITSYSIAAFSNGTLVEKRESPRQRTGRGVSVCVERFAFLRPTQFVMLFVSSRFFSPFVFCVIRFASFYYKIAKERHVSPSGMFLPTRKHKVERRPMPKRKKSASKPNVIDW